MEQGHTNASTWHCAHECGYLSFGENNDPCTTPDTGPGQDTRI